MEGTHRQVLACVDGGGGMIRLRNVSGILQPIY